MFPEMFDKMWFALSIFKNIFVELFYFTLESVILKFILFSSQSCIAYLEDIRNMTRKIFIAKKETR